MLTVFSSKYSLTEMLAWLSCSENKKSRGHSEQLLTLSMATCCSLFLTSYINIFSCALSPDKSISKHPARKRLWDWAAVSAVHKSWENPQKNRMTQGLIGQGKWISSENLSQQSHTLFTHSCAPPSWLAFRGEDDCCLTYCNSVIITALMLTAHPQTKKKKKKKREKHSSLS